MVAGLRAADPERLTNASSWPMTVVVADDVEVAAGWVVVGEAGLMVVDDHVDDVERTVSESGIAIAAVDHRGTQDAAPPASSIEDTVGVVGAAAAVEARMLEGAVLDRPFM